MPSGLVACVSAGAVWLCQQPSQVWPDREQNCPLGGWRFGPNEDPTGSVTEGDRPFRWKRQCPVTRHISCVFHTQRACGHLRTAPLAQESHRPRLARTLPRTYHFVSKRHLDDGIYHLQKQERTPVRQNWNEGSFSISNPP